MRFRSLVIFALAVTVVASALYLWLWPNPSVERAQREADVSLPPATEPSASPPPPPAPPPEPGELQQTVDRVFDLALVVDRTIRPAFLAGDFNGDEVTDLAVAVRPRGEGSLAKLNAEMPTWRLQDATALPPETPGQRGALRIADGERLLAVLHGVDDGAWRSPGAPACLVKNAVGSGMRLRLLATAPEAVRMRTYRYHTGDVIAEDREGRTGLVFWNGAVYSWADLGPSRP